MEQKIKKFIVSRFMYRIGQPILSDQEYDLLEKNLKDVEEVKEYMERTWEDDPVPTELLQEFYGEEETERLLISNNLKDYNNNFVSSEEFKAQSIYPARYLSEALEWNNAHVGMEVLYMPKIDGISTSHEYAQNVFRSSRTRGRRGGDSFIDISDNCKHALPAKLNVNNLTLNAEAFVSEDDMEYYTEITGTNFTSPRMCGISAVRRAEFPKQLIANTLQLYVFNSSYGDTLKEGIDFARSLGFKTVPYLVRTIEHYSSESEYLKAITPIMKGLKDFTDDRGIPTDGVVIQVNDRKSFAAGADVGEKYTAHNLAFKCLFWEEEKFISVVKDIEIFQAMKSKQNFSVKLIVEPIKTKSGKTLQTINMYNLKTLIDSDVTIGDTIEFAHFNDTSIKFVRKVV